MHKKTALISSVSTHDVVSLAKVKLVRYFDEGNEMYLVFELCEGANFCWVGKWVEIGRAWWYWIIGLLYLFWCTTNMSDLRFFSFLDSVLNNLLNIIPLGPSGQSRLDRSLSDGQDQICSQDWKVKASWVRKRSATEKKTARDTWQKRWSKGSRLDMSMACSGMKESRVVS